MSLQSRLMPLRLRKLIGMVLLVALVVVYALVAIAVAVSVLPGQPAWVEAAFFLVSGLCWVLPAMLVIWWMSRPDRPPSNAP